MIKTMSEFFYGIELNEFNQYIDFSEGAGPTLSAKLSIGYYTHSELLIELSKKMNALGLGTYEWNINRSTRQLTVNADITFKLPCTSGPHATSGIWELLGMNGPDKVSSNNYTGLYSSGTSYRPQFFLQNYMGTDQNSSPVESSLNISGSGKRELVRFGIESLMECEIKYITNFYMPDGSQIENNASGFEDVKAFMEYLILGGHIEFMKDRNNPNDFESLQLKSTSESAEGISYRIEEMIDVGILGYYKINKLTFRKIEL